MDKIAHNTADPDRTPTEYNVTVEQLQAEIHQLQRENEELQKNAMNSKSAIQLQKMQQNRMQQKLQMANHNAEQMLIKYNNLAASKLGRLALKIWDWKAAIRSAKARGGIKEVIRWFLTPSMRRSKAADKPQMSDAQMDWIDGYIDQLAWIADSNGCRYYQKLPHRIGLICDGFFYESISAAADFVFITPDNWEQELDNGLDVMLFVTAWRGLHEEWRGLGAINDMTRNPTRMLALKILDRCKEKNIPTVFYSKEDPPNYEVFVEYAKHCDYIRTTAQECIPHYVKDCGNERVQSVCFGINPVFHNPIGFRSVEKEKTVLFSGSWMLKYPDRCRELAVIFDGILDSDYGLHIIDRNYPSNERMCFPEKYFAFSSPALPHDMLQKVHKLFDWAININSVKASETMFANRAYELQANGVLLMSNLSVGMNSLLPNVQIVLDSSEVTDILNSMTDEERYEKQIAGVRSVMTGHTCFDRIAQLLETTGLDVRQPVRRILVLSDKITESVRSSFERQTYPDKVLMEAASVSAETIAEYDMIAWFAPNADYGTFYLEDMANGFKYTACDYITKDAWLEAGVLHQGVEHDYVTQMGSKYRTLFWREAFDPAFLLTISGMQMLGNGYSIDHFNYDAAPLQQKKPERSYLLSVIVPVYNNGRHLYGKCFSSLRRSSMFKDMEIILVDDGSTDLYTLQMETYLERNYDNVRTYRFDGNGSGSASRPRNKGVELATAEYLTFLDPDNEAVCNGYARMYEIAREQECDLVIGNMYKCNDNNEIADNYGRIFKAVGSESVENGLGEALVNSSFVAASIQAMVIRTDLIRNNGLEQVPGAADQDTLFSWQLMYYAKRAHILNLPIHVYYSQTAGSVTNVVGPKFFNKLLLLQKPKAEWLNAVGLMKDYMTKSHNYYITKLVFKKLGQVSEKDAEECAKLVKQILAEFAPYYDNTDPVINDFTQLCEQGHYDEAAAFIRQKYPVTQGNLIPTLEELRNPGNANVYSNVYALDYIQSGNVFTFHRLAADRGTKVAWVVLVNSGKYQKVFETKYSREKSFRYDFSQLPPDSYRVRVFWKKGNEKIAKDAAIIEVNATGEAVMKMTNKEIF